MFETVFIPVTYKGQELSFPARLIVMGYTHKFSVEINGQEFLFEPDEERNYRAIVDPSAMNDGKRIDVDLFKTIASALESL